MENDPKPYKFMKESIKKQPPDWKKIVLLIAGWLALAALGGLVAAAVFAVTEPKIAEAVTREEPPAKVDIPGDEDPNSGQEPDETITASSASASVDSSGSGSEISSSTVDSSTSESSVSESTVSESTEENGAAGNGKQHFRRAGGGQRGFQCRWGNGCGGKGQQPEKL